MGKYLYIAEKPSVAQEFARVLGVTGARKDGYLESDGAVVTWCVGHLVTMSYPEVYDPNLRFWKMETIPFIPTEWKYEVISDVKKQFQTVKTLLNRPDVERIYVCTDSGREGEYIYRLVRQMAGVKGKDERRVWIDSQTEEEIRRGVREAKPISEYDHLSSAAYLRAKEDYLMGINFSRALTLKFGDILKQATGSQRREAISVGRVMTCVLGMVVRREREIRDFVPTPFYRVLLPFRKDASGFSAEWKAVPGSRYFESPLLYKENGFRKKESAEALSELLKQRNPREGAVSKIEKKQEKKGAPLLFNLAELQNECSRRFKKSPDQTLELTQKLYEKKLVTYPRTDARVLSSAVAKVIDQNLRGLSRVPFAENFAKKILESGSFRRIGSSPYTDDKKITDHYAIIPTGQGLSNLQGLTQDERNVYELICLRFLAIFYPPAVYEKVALEMAVDAEHFFTNVRCLKTPGYLEVYPSKKEADKKNPQEKQEEENEGDEHLLALLDSLKKGDVLPYGDPEIKEGTTTAPKRYSSGSLILAMENAGQLIEDDDLRAQIKGSGIGTSATRAEIIKKLCTISYLFINQKTQIVTPCMKGEMVYDICFVALRSLLNAELTASWEKGLTMVSEGAVSEEEYMGKLSDFVTKKTEGVKGITGAQNMMNYFRKVFPYYKKG